MKTFDNQGHKYLRKEFGKTVLDLALKQKKGGYSIINKSNCGNGGTESLLSLDMSEYPGVYLFLISHSKAGVKGKEKENNHADVVFLHGDKRNNLTIQKDRQHYMCTPEGISKRWEGLESLFNIEGSRVVFIFDEIHKAVLDRSFRDFRFLIGYKKAISLGITATPHRSQYKRTILTVTGLPKLNVKSYVYKVENPTTHLMHYIQKRIQGNDKSKNSLILAFHDANPILRLLEWGYRMKYKIYVEAGNSVSTIVNILSIKNDVVTDNVDEADFFLGTSSIVDSVSLFHSTAKSVEAFICMDSAKPQIEGRNDFKRFTDAEAYQLPFRFRNATEFKLVKIEKEVRGDYSAVKSNALYWKSKRKHFVNYNDMHISGHVLHDWKHKTLGQFGVKKVMRDTYLEEVLVNAAPEDKVVIIDGEEYKKTPKFYFPYKFKEKQGLELTGPLPDKPYINPDIYYESEIDDDRAWRHQAKLIADKVTIEKEKGSKILMPCLRLLYFYVYCKIYKKELSTQIGEITVDKKTNHITGLPDISILYDKLEKGTEKLRALKISRFHDLLQYIRTDLSIKRFEQMRFDNRIIQNSENLKKLKALYEYTMNSDKDHQEWAREIVDDTNRDQMFEDGNGSKLIEESQVTSFHDMVLSRFSDYYERERVPLQEALTVLCENERLIRVAYQQNRQYGQLSKLPKLTRHMILNVLYGESGWRCYDCKSAALSSICAHEYGVEIPSWGFYKGSGIEREKSKRVAVIFTHKYFFRDEHGDWFHYNKDDPYTTLKPAKNYLELVSKHLPDAFIQAHIESSHKMLELCTKEKEEVVSFFSRHTYHEKRIMAEFKKRLAKLGLRVNSVHDEVYMFGTDFPKKNDELFMIKASDMLVYNPFTLQTAKLESWRDRVKYTS